LSRYVCYLSVVIYGDRLVPSVFGRLLPKEETCEQEETRRMIPLVETKLHGSELQLELGDTIDQSHHKQAVQVVPMDMWAWMNTKQWDPTAVVLALTMPPIEVRASLTAVCTKRCTPISISCGWDDPSREPSSRGFRMPSNV
jgi:hypothetical protein